ncbi:MULTISPECIES: hypothetical protein [Streptomyces]|uniref:hypothetical protein n=2 Tax=Streptomyces TaxID=1883 RepID=UPI0033BD3864
MRTRIWLAGVAVVAAALTGCSGAATSTDGGRKDTGASHSAQAPAEDSAKKDVKITRSGFENHPVWGEHAYVTHYTITNHGPAAADYFVQLEYLDSDGDVLGTTGVDATKLGPNKTNTGDTAPVDAEITNGKMSDIKSVRVSEVSRTDPAA